MRLVHAADAADAAAGPEKPVYSVLTPNAKGLEAALECGADEVAVFVSASEGFSKANINATVEEGLERAEAVTELALAAGVTVRGYVSCVLGCPYDGDVDPAVPAAVARRLVDMGIAEVSLGDTIGVGTPAKTLALLAACEEAGVPVEKLAVHFHDTYGMACANVYVERGRCRCCCYCSDYCCCWAALLLCPPRLRSRRSATITPALLLLLRRLLLANSPPLSGTPRSRPA